MCLKRFTETLHPYGLRNRVWMKVKILPLPSNSPTRYTNGKRFFIVQQGKCFCAMKAWAINSVHFAYMPRWSCKTGCGHLGAFMIAYGVWGFWNSFEKWKTFALFGVINTRKLFYAHLSAQRCTVNFTHWYELVLTNSTIKATCTCTCQHVQRGTEQPCNILIVPVPVSIRKADESDFEAIFLWVCVHDFT